MPMLAMMGGLIGANMAGQAMFYGTQPGKDADIPKIDMAPAQALMAGAMQSMNNFANMGFGSYVSALNGAQDKVQQAYASVQSQLKPMSDAGRESYNEYLRMIGQDPVQKTAGFGARLDGLDLKGDASGLKGLFDMAAKEKDANKRMELKGQIVDQMNSLKLQDNRAKEIAALGGVPTPVALTATPFTYTIDGKTGYFKKIEDIPTLRAMENNIRVEHEARMESYNLAKTAINERWDAKLKQETELKNQLLTDFQNNYGEAYDAAYDGDTINKKVQETAGYQVALQQGGQSVARAGAAAGMLGSGNTLLATQKMGQDLASNTYQSTLNNLLGSAGQGAQADEVLTNLELQKGSILSSMDQAYGQAANQYLVNKGQVNATALNTQATSYLQTATQNINNLLTWKMQQAQLEAAQKGAKGAQMGQIASTTIQDAGQTQRLGMQLGAQAAEGYGLLNGYQQGNRYGNQNGNYQNF